MSASPTTDRRALLQEALEAVERMPGQARRGGARRSEPIAIVGIGCRIPGRSRDTRSLLGAAA